MLLIKDVPLVSLQTALFKLLKNGQDVPIYGRVPTTAKLPYLTVGAVTAKPVTVKNSVIWNMSINVDVWGNNDGKLEVNECLNDISALITYRGESLELEKYKVISVEIDLVESFPAADGGYHGTLSANFNLQQI